jgi:hypothetical protein
LLGSPIELDMIFDFNNAVFLPTNFVGAQYEIVDTPQLPVVTAPSWLLKLHQHQLLWLLQLPKLPPKLLQPPLQQPK